MQKLQVQCSSFIEDLKEKANHRRLERKARVSKGRQQVSSVVEIAASSVEDVKPSKMEASVSTEGSSGGSGTSVGKMTTLPRILGRAAKWSTNFAEILGKIQGKLNTTLASPEIKLEEKLNVSAEIVEDLKNIIGQFKGFCSDTEQSLNEKICVPVGTGNDGQPKYDWVRRNGEYSEEKESDDDDDFVEDPYVSRKGKRPSAAVTNRRKKKRRLDNGEGTSGMVSAKPASSIEDLEEFFVNTGKTSDSNTPTINSGLEEATSRPLSPHEKPQGGDGELSNSTTASSPTVTTEYATASQNMDHDGAEAMEDEILEQDIEMKEVEDAKDSPHSSLEDLIQAAEEDVECGTNGDQCEIIPEDSSERSSPVDQEFITPTQSPMPPYASISIASGDSETGNSARDALLNELDDDLEEQRPPSNEDEPEEHQSKSDGEDSVRNAILKELDEQVGNGDSHCDSDESSNEREKVEDDNCEESENGEPEEQQPKNDGNEAIKNNVLNDLDDDLGEQQAGGESSSNSGNSDDSGESDKEDDGANGVELGNETEGSSSLPKSNKKTKTHGPKENLAKLEEGYDPDLEKELNAMQRALNWKNGGKSQSVPKTTTRSKKQKGDAEIVTSDDEASTDDCGEAENVQDQAGEEDPNAFWVSELIILLTFMKIDGAIIGFERRGAR